MRKYAAFISYSSRYRDWVKTLQSNLELCLPRHGVDRKVFLDQTDLGPGRSWVTQLQAGIDEADHLVLVVTPEAMASARVKNEWECLIAADSNWEGRLQVVMLVETPLPPFLGSAQRLDFREHALIFVFQPLVLMVKALHDPVQLKGGFEKLILGFRDGHRSRHAILLYSSGTIPRDPRDPFTQTPCSSSGEPRQSDLVDGRPSAAVARSPR